MTAGRVVVVGLGPAGPELVTEATRAALERIPHRYLRTSRHPSAVIVGGAVTFDERYEAAEHLDDVYTGIVATLVAEASEHGEVLYAVPGSPLVAERTVELLRAHDGVEVEVVPALSYLDLAWSALGVDPLAAGVRLVDGRRFATEAAGERGPLLVAQCDSPSVLSNVKLAVDPFPAEPVTVLQRLGTPDATVFTVPWAELDRSFPPDHLTTLWIPALAAPVGQELVAFHELVRTLREECPWDREQTHRTLTKYLVEETYEVLDAIDALDGSADADEHLCEELGDLLFQVEFHATIAEQEGRFTMADVAAGIAEKLVRRHPHVFSGVEADTPEQVAKNWDAIKRDERKDAERPRTSALDGVPTALPALAYAAKLQSRAARVGFDWPDVHGALAKVGEEAAEVVAARADAEGADGEGDGNGTAAVHDEVGDLLFAVVNVARHLGVDGEAALRSAATKFQRRFRAVEALARDRGTPLDHLDLAGLDALWDQVKAAEHAR
jgi:tetrapyrrole methylase family protein/MazG family protein